MLQPTEVLQLKREKTLIKWLRLIRPFRTIVGKINFKDKLCHAVTI
jgi:hypothetical protein